MADNEKILEVLADMANGLESLAVNLKRQVAELAGVKEEQKPAAVAEMTFAMLKFEPQKGEKLGDFETASPANNIPEKFNTPFNILKQNNSGINSRYHGQGYQFAYWIYGDRIFRQKLKTKT